MLHVYQQHGDWGVWMFHGKFPHVWGRHVKSTQRGPRSTGCLNNVKAVTWVLDKLYWPWIGYDDFHSSQCVSCCLCSHWLQKRCVLAPAFKNRNAELLFVPEVRAWPWQIKTFGLSSTKYSPCSRWPVFHTLVTSQSLCRDQFKGF